MPRTAARTAHAASSPPETANPTALKAGVAHSRRDLDRSPDGAAKRDPQHSEALLGI